MVVVDVVRDTQARIAYENEQAQERRVWEQAEQRSALNTPAFRIRLWEKRHQLALPLKPQHRLIDVIAAATALTREDVEKELQQRSDASAATPA